MDPYLEDAGRWRGFHVSFLTHLVEELNGGLPEPYTADLEESVELVELDAPSFREALPDANITRGSAVASARTATGSIYLRKLNYRKPPHVSLSEQDRASVAETLAAAGANA